MGEAPATRVMSVDLMRGVTMAAMIVVNNPGSWAHMFAPLRHAEWGGWPTPADLVFPFFLFLVGASVPLALGRRRDRGASRIGLLRRATRRAALLFAMGLALNLFPHFELESVRIPGVLQRIALVYLACVSLYLAMSARGLAVTAVGLLVGYTSWLKFVPVPGVGAAIVTPETSWPVWLDEALLGAHTWRGPGDPEGLLSTLPAISTGITGMLAIEWLRRTNGPGASDASVRHGLAGPRGLALAGAAVAGAGVLLSGWVVPAKDIWTASYALLTAGAAVTVLAGFQWVLTGGESSGTSPGVRVFRLLGREALLAYVAAHLLSDLSIYVLVWPGGHSLHVLVHRGLLASWPSPRVASLVYSLLVLAACIAVAAVAERRGWRLRI